MQKGQDMLRFTNLLIYSKKFKKFKGFNLSGNYVWEIHKASNEYNSFVIENSYNFKK